MADGDTSILAPQDASGLVPAILRNQQATQGLLAQKQQQTAPLVSQMGQILSTQRPQLPQLQGTPSAPSRGSDQRQQVESFFPIAIALAAIAGSRSRYHVSASLNAFGAAIRGFRQGQLDVWDQQSKEFEQQAQAAIRTNELKLQQYRLALDDRKASIDEQMTRIQMIASMYNDELMARAAATRDYIQVAQLIDTGTNLNREYQLKRDEMMEKKREYDEQMDVKLYEKGLQRDPKTNKITQIPGAMLGADEKELRKRATALAAEASGLPDDDPRKAQLDAESKRLFKVLRDAKAAEAPPKAVSIEQARAELGLPLMKQANDAITSLSAKGTTLPYRALVNLGNEGFGAQAYEKFITMTLSADQQQMYAAARQFATYAAQVLPTYGGARPEVRANTLRIYLPVTGDTPTVIADKETARRKLLDVTASIAGPGGADTSSIPPDAIRDLKADPSAKRKQQFDEIFGAGSADRALSGP